MCELLGISSAEPVHAAEYLKKFFPHSIDHPHGWGMMYEDNGRQIVKEPVRACDSTLLHSLIGTIPAQKTLLAHIRFATVGSIRIENCHPYTGTDISGRIWTLIHNGTIWSGRLNFQYFKKQKGDTDSERLFLALMDQVNENICQGRYSERSRFQIVNDFITANAPRNKINLMIYDGDLLYVHKNMRNTLSYKKLKNGIIFSTQPLDARDWYPFPTAQVIAYRNGSEVYRGQKHEGIYIPALETIAVGDAMNI